MLSHYPELARLLNEERVDEARRSMRGFCCAQDKRDLEKSHRPTRPAADPATCSC